MLMMAISMKLLNKGIGNGNKNLNLPDIFVFSLAIADTCYLSAVGSFTMYTYLVGTWAFGQATCKFLFVTEHLCATLALEHIVGISLLRYLLVVHNKRIVPRWYGTAIALSLMYLLLLVPILCNVPKSGLAFFSTTMNCISIERALGQGQSPSAIPVLVVLVVIALGLAACYLHIYFHVGRSRANIQNSSENDEAQMNPTLVKREIKLMTTIAYAFFSFLLTPSRHYS